MRQMLRRLCAPAVVLVVALTTIPAAASGTGSWTTAAVMTTPRGELAAATGGDGKTYALGGCCDINTGDILDTNEAYDPTTDSWSPAASMPNARSFFDAVAGADGRIYVFGGCCQSGGGDYTAVDIYDPSTNSWTSGAPDPVAREEQSAALGADGRIYVFGGCCNGGNVLTTAEAYNPSLNAWSTLTPMPLARADAGAATVGTKIYVIGGSNGTHQATVQAYDTSTDSWTTVAPLPSARDNVAAALGADGRLYAIGGCCGPGISALSTVTAYDAGTNTWSTVASLPDARDELAAAFGSDGRTYAIGGINSTFDDQDSNFAYTPSTGTVSVTSATPSALGQGAQAPVLVKGSGFQSGATFTVSGTGVTVLATTLLSSTRAKLLVQVSSSAPVGPRTVTVTNPDTTTASCPGCLTVDPNPKPTSTSPTSGARGATLDVDVLGSDFQNGAKARFGPRITVNSTTFVNAGHLVANITILASAATGPRAVMVVNPDRGTGSCAGCFTVT